MNKLTDNERLLLATALYWKQRYDDTFDTMSGGPSKESLLDEALEALPTALRQAVNGRDRQDIIAQCEGMES